MARAMAWVLGGVAGAIVAIVLALAALMIVAEVHQLGGGDLGAWAERPYVAGSRWVVPASCLVGLAWVASIAVATWATGRLLTTDLRRS